MSESEFYHSTMKYIVAKVKAHSEANNAKIKHLEYSAWLTGSYVRHAVWGKKYPKCPVKDELEEITDAGAVRDLTDDEQARAEELIMERFEELMAHHTQRKKREGSDSNGG